MDSLLVDLPPAARRSIDVQVPLSFLQVAPAR
jgi:hypothetical protein